MYHQGDLAWLYNLRKCYREELEIPEWTYEEFVSPASIHLFVAVFTFSVHRNMRIIFLFFLLKLFRSFAIWSFDLNPSIEYSILGYATLNLRAMREHRPNSLSEPALSFIHEIWVLYFFIG